MLFETRSKSQCATVVLLEICDMCKQAKNLAKLIAQLKTCLNWLVRSVCATTNLKKIASSVKKVKKTTRL